MRFVLPALFGLIGFAVLCGLGFWQLERMAWKHGVIDRIETRIAAEPVALPATPDAEADEYLPVTLQGRVDGPHIRVLGAWLGGSGYRIVAPVVTGERRIMVDLGIVPFEDKDLTLPTAPLTLTGNLAWPEETGPSTPVPSGFEWYGRDVPGMAELLETEPVLVVARAVTPEIAPRPSPVGTEGIPDSHLGYAIQWFGLAAVWLGMTLFLLWRIRRRTL